MFVVYAPVAQLDRVFASEADSHRLNWSQVRGSVLKFVVVTVVKK